MTNGLNGPVTPRSDADAERAALLGEVERLRRERDEYRQMHQTICDELQRTIAACGWGRWEKMDAVVKAAEKKTPHVLESWCEDLYDKPDLRRYLLGLSKALAAHKEAP